MSEVLVLIVVVAVLVAGGMYVFRQQVTNRGQVLDDAVADARRWVERLGGQVLNLQGTDAASRQALADASERYTAAGSQVEQARSIKQAQLAKDTALEGLYYVHAARKAMGLDPGPDLPDSSERARSGSVTEERSVDVDGHRYKASPQPAAGTPHYYPGGRVAGRPVPSGWYSEPWWKSAVRAGAWGVGSYLLFDAMFSGMDGIAGAQAWEAGYDAGQLDGMNGGFDGGGFDGGFDGGGFDAGGFGGADASGTIDGGSDFGDFGGGDFGGFDGF